MSTPNQAPSSRILDNWLPYRVPDRKSRTDVRSQETTDDRILDRARVDGLRERGHVQDLAEHSLIVLVVISFSSSTPVFGQDVQP